MGHGNAHRGVTIRRAPSSRCTGLQTAVLGHDSACHRRFRLISSRYWQVGARAKAAPLTSMAMASSACPISSTCSTTGGRVREEEGTGH